MAMKRKRVSKGGARKKRNVAPKDIAMGRKRTRAQGKYRSVKRRVVRKGKSASGQLQVVKKTLGVRGTSVMGIGQLRKATVNSSVWRFQNIASYDRSNDGTDRGAFYLGPAFCTTSSPAYAHIQTSRSRYCQHNWTMGPADGTSFFRCGYHLYCLNGTHANGGGSTVGYQPMISMADGMVTFPTLRGPVNNDGANATTNAEWQLESTDSDRDYNIPQRYIRQAWYDIRLQLRNAKEQQTWFDIMVFQFKEAHLDPEDVPGGASELEDRRAFYAGLAREGYWQPVMPNSVLRKPFDKVRVIKRMRVQLNPQTNDDTNASPTVKTVKMFVRDGKMYDYLWSADGPGPGVVDQQILLGSDWQVQGLNGTAYEKRPKARARIWLMVRAFDPRASASSAGEDLVDAVVNTPSYDICIRKKEEVAIKGLA